MNLFDQSNSMDYKYLSNYSISFDLSSPKLRGLLVGRNQIIRESLERKNEVEIQIDREDPKVVISGRMDNVKKAEMEISK